METIRRYGMKLGDVEWGIVARVLLLLVMRVIWWVVLVLIGMITFWTVSAFLGGIFCDDGRDD